ncbi:hypothetical protein LTSEBAI_0578 [Salmonella enterica subsp. enterica serovar Baildon str. R6-199]|nr:hypothetical protein LTSEBAI_0578 [Salmonella enterica subsp. enterica serovar Baildon str. R6-199]
MCFITTQKALAIHRAFIFAVKTSVYEPGHMPPVLPTERLFCQCRIALTLSQSTEHYFVGPVSASATGH